MLDTNYGYRFLQNFVILTIYARAELISSVWSKFPSLYKEGIMGKIYIEPRLRVGRQYETILDYI